MSELVLYSRMGCHLCTDMENLLREFSADYSYTFTVIDIDSDSQLRERFNALVPALYLGEQEVCHHFLDLQQLKTMLAQPVAADTAVSKVGDNLTHEQG